MKAWEEFYPDVLPEVMGCPDPLVDIALRRSAQRFMEKTEVWRVWLLDVTTNGGTEHFIELENNSELSRLIQAALDGIEIKVYGPDQIPPGWRFGRSDFQTGVLTTDRKVVQLVPAQAAGLTLSIEAALKPSNSAAGITDDLFDQYRVQIATGAKAILMAQPEKAWTNTGMAGTYAEVFQSEIDDIASRAWRGYGSATPRVRGSFL